MGFKRELTFAGMDSDKLAVAETNVNFESNYK
jgi:hypothetical protein